MTSDDARSSTTDLALLRAQLARQEEHLARQQAELAALRQRVGRRHARSRPQRWLAGLALALLLALVPLSLLAAGFTDLNAGSPHNDNINAIAAAGITKGCNPPTNDNYCPNEFVTREQMASFLARTAGLGGNPPVASALTAQSVPDNSVTAAKLSGVGSTAGQTLVSTGTGVAWQSPATGTGTIIGYIAESVKLYCQDGTDPACYGPAPKAGVTVYLSGTTIAATSDAGGKFVLTGVPVGIWSVKLVYSAPPLDGEGAHVIGRMGESAIPNIRITAAGQTVEIPGYHIFAGAVYPVYAR